MEYIYGAKNIGDYRWHIRSVHRLYCFRDMCYPRRAHDSGAAIALDITLGNNDCYPPAKTA